MLKEDAEAAARERHSLQDRISRVVGTTRRARLATAATAIALLLAVVAFFALDSSDDDAIPRDAYTVAADGQCIAAKRQIVSSERRFLTSPGGAETSEVAKALLPIVATWRSDFGALSVPADRLEQARQLDSALREVEIAIGELARVADEGDRRQTLASARGADGAATRVEGAIASLGLSQCGRLTLGLTPD
jgi:hypothetical protein